jgi:parvulin-like peptidyl-prolyl isomerase
MRRTPASATALILVALVLPACGDDSPSPSDVSSDDVAIVGDETISKQELDARIKGIRRALRGGDPRDALEYRDELEDQAISQLLREKALLQEAENLGVSVSGDKVRERLALAKRQFKSNKAYKQFLGDQTQHDVLQELRLQMLAERVGAAMAKDGEAPEDFELELQRRWRPKTACNDGYVSSACPN